MLENRWSFVDVPHDSFYGDQKQLRWLYGAQGRTVTVIWVQVKSRSRIITPYFPAENHKNGRRKHRIRELTYSEQTERTRKRCSCSGYPILLARHVLSRKQQMLSPHWWQTETLIPLEPVLYPYLISRPATIESPTILPQVASGWGGQTSNRCIWVSIPGNVQNVPGCGSNDLTGPVSIDGNTHVLSIPFYFRG